MNTYLFYLLFFCRSFRFATTTSANRINRTNNNNNLQRCQRLYTQLEVLKNKTLRQDNPHISKRRGGRKPAHRRFSLQVHYRSFSISLFVSFSFHSHSLFGSVPFSYFVLLVCVCVCVSFVFFLLILYVGVCVCLTLYVKKRVLLRSIENLVKK